MNTDDLIKAMVADNATVSPPVSRTVSLGIVTGLALATAVFFWLLHVRSDFLYAITNEPRFMFKFVFTVALGIPALFLVQRLSRPDGDSGWPLKLLLLAPLLLAAAVFMEMNTVPAEQWSLNAMGSMPGACMKYIPILSLAPLAAALFAMRQGATAHPVAAGAAAGLLSAAIGASLYATFCVDDSPMFLAIWYVGGVAMVVALGALAGSRVLRW